MPSLLTHLAFISLILNFSYACNQQFLNVSESRSGSRNSGNWSPATASWYGNPSGAGSDGGACGYQNAVGTAPFSSLITAAASSIYNSGKACGTCYQVKCTANLCSGNPVTVVITDECPGCDSQSIKFDLSGTSFGKMARSGASDQLRNVGLQQIQYRRVDCNFPGVSVAFRVDPGSNPYYFATAIQFGNGNGIAGAELKRDGGAWIKMQQSWGAVWKADLPANYPPPFTVRLTGGNGKTIIAKKVIPANYSPGKTYMASIKFFELI